MDYLPTVTGPAMTAVRVFDDTQRARIAALISQEQDVHDEPRYRDARRAAWQQAVAAKLLDLAPSTRRAYRFEIDRWEAFLAQADVEPYDAEVLYARVLDEQLGLAPSSTARALAALSGIYRDLDLQQPGLTRGNPFAQVRRPKVSTVSSTPSLTLDEARTFLAAARTVSPRAAALALLLLSTGLRIGEVLAADTATWSPRAAARRCSRSPARATSAPTSPCPIRSWRPSPRTPVHDRAAPAGRSSAGSATTGCTWARCSPVTAAAP